MGVVLTKEEENCKIFWAGEPVSLDIQNLKPTGLLNLHPDRLEASHDYIQTLFPLPEASGVNDRAPIINEEVFLAFQKRQDLKGHFLEAFQKILWFYGFVLIKEDGKTQVIPGPNFGKHSKNFNTRFDHNHLRITRIIRSCRVLGILFTTHV